MQWYDKVILLLSAPLIIVQEMIEFDIIGKGHSGQISSVISYIVQDKHNCC